MWRENEELAIMVDLDLNTYWHLNPNQFNKYVNVYNKKQKQEIELQDSLNYLLGKYVAFAFNDVKHFPKKPFLEDSSKPMKEMTADEMEKQVLFNTKKLGGKI